MVTWENYEEYLIMHADGELDAAEERALRAFINEHEELEAELEMYEQVRLTPDKGVTFAEKETLLKDAPKIRVIRLRPWRKYAVAAGILALVCLAATKWLLPPTSEGRTDRGTLAFDNKQSTVTSLESEINQQRVAASQQLKDRSKQSSANQTTTGHNAIVVAKTNKRTSLIQRFDKTDNKTKNEDSAPIDRMKIIALKTIEHRKTEIIFTEPIAVQQTTEPAVVAEGDPANLKTKKSLLDLLNPSDDDRPRMETIKNVVASSVESVRHIKKSIKQSDISFKLGGREIAVVNF